MNTLRGQSHGKRIATPHASGRDRRYVSLARGNAGSFKNAGVEVAERLNIKCVVHSNNDALGATGLAFGYKQLRRVEVAWALQQSSFYDDEAKISVM